MATAKFLLDTSIAKAENLKYDEFATDETIRSIVKEHLDKDGLDADLNMIDVSQVTNMSNLFYDGDFYGDISQWDVSNVVDFTRMFNRCRRFNCDIGAWDTRSAKSFNGMFFRCASFNKDIGMWDVSNANDMTYMFYGCSSFDKDLSKWDVSSMELADGMFGACFNFRGKGLDKWKLDNIRSMSYMFKDCRSFKTSLKKWVIDGNTYMEEFNLGCMFLRSNKNKPQIQINYKK